MTARALFRLAALLLLACAVVQTLALVGTQEVKRFLMLAGKAALSSDAVGLLLFGAVIFFSFSCASRAWSVAKRPPSPKERAELLAKGYAVLPANVDVSKFFDGPPFTEETKPRA